MLNVITKKLKVEKQELKTLNKIQCKTTQVKVKMNDRVLIFFSGRLAVYLLFLCLQHLSTTLLLATLMAALLVLAEARMLSRCVVWDVRHTK